MRQEPRLRTILDRRGDAVGMSIVHSWRGRRIIYNGLQYKKVSYQRNPTPLAPVAIVLRGGLPLEIKQLSRRNCIASVISHCRRKEIDQAKPPLLIVRFIAK